jgi:type IV pilus assembly protein PilN
MRLDINLATRPYEDAREFWRRWGLLLGIVSVVTLALLALTVTGWYSARRDRRRIADLRQQIAKIDQERLAAEAMLNRPENRAMREKSQYLNDLIARKSFSWTQAIERLEKVMPPKLHLISIEPHLTEDNQLSMKMVVAGDSPERAIELMRRMEASKHFRETQIADQTQLQTPQSTDTVQFSINALYVPPDEPDSATEPKSGIDSRRAH